MKFFSNKWFQGKCIKIVWGKTSFISNVLYQKKIDLGHVYSLDPSPWKLIRLWHHFCSELRLLLRGVSKFILHCNKLDFDARMISLHFYQKLQPACMLNSNMYDSTQNNFAFENCHPYMWPSTTKWGSLRGISKLRKVLHCSEHLFSTHFDAKMVTLQYSYQKLWNVGTLYWHVGYHPKLLYRDLGCQR